MSEEKPSLPWDQHKGQGLPTVLKTAQKLDVIDAELIASRFVYSLDCLEIFFGHGLCGIEKELLTKYSEQDWGVSISTALISPIKNLLHTAKQEGRAFDEQPQGSQVVTVRAFVGQIDTYYDWPTFYNLPDSLASRLGEVNQALGKAPNDISFDGNVRKALYELADKHFRDKSARIMSSDERVILLHTIDLLNSPMMHQMSWDFEHVAKHQGEEAFAAVNSYGAPNHPPRVVVDLRRAQEQLPSCFFETFAAAKQIGLFNVGGEALVVAPGKDLQQCGRG